MSKTYCKSSSLCQSCGLPTESKSENVYCKCKQSNLLTGETSECFKENNSMDCSRYTNINSNDQSCNVIQIEKCNEKSMTNYQTQEDNIKSSNNDLLTEVPNQSGDSIIRKPCLDSSNLKVSESQSSDSENDNTESSDSSSPEGEIVEEEKDLSEITNKDEETEDGYQSHENVQSVQSNDVEEKDDYSESICFSDFDESENQSSKSVDQKFDNNKSSDLISPLGDTLDISLFTDNSITKSENSVLDSEEDSISNAVKNGSNNNLSCSTDDSIPGIKNSQEVEKQDGPTFSGCSTDNENTIAAIEDLLLKPVISSADSSLISDLLSKNIENGLDIKEEQPNESFISELCAADMPSSSGSCVSESTGTDYYILPLTTETLKESPCSESVNLEDSALELSVVPDTHNQDSLLTQENPLAEGPTEPKCTCEEPACKDTTLSTDTVQTYQLNDQNPSSNSLEQVNSTYSDSIPLDQFAEVNSLDNIPKQNALDNSTLFPSNDAAEVLNSQMKEIPETGMFTNPGIAPPLGGHLGPASFL